VHRRTMLCCRRIINYEITIRLACYEFGRALFFIKINGGNILTLFRHNPNKRSCLCFLVKHQHEKYYKTIYSSRIAGSIVVGLYISAPFAYAANTKFAAALIHNLLVFKHRHNILNYN
jgi:hypothetical protein